MSYEEGEEVELAGELIELSSRFYKNGWGFGTLRQDNGKLLKITGTLQGRAVGERLNVKGIWRIDEKWGAQLALTVATPDIKNATTESVRKWFERLAKEHARIGMGLQDEEEAAAIREAGEQLCAYTEAGERWDVMSSETALVALGIPYANVIATEATKQLEKYKKIEQLQAWGFTDKEIHFLADDVVSIKGPDDVYELVAVNPMFTFARVDAICDKAWNVSPLHSHRIRAAVYCSLRACEDRGHTAANVVSLAEAASRLLQLYPDQIYVWMEETNFAHRAVEEAERFSLMTFQIYEGYVQLTSTASAEDALAQFTAQSSNQWMQSMQSTVTTDET